MIQKVGFINECIFYLSWKNRWLITPNTAYLLVNSFLTVGKDISITPPGFVNIDTWSNCTDLGHHALFVLQDIFCLYFHHIWIFFTILNRGISFVFAFISFHPWFGYQFDFLLPYCYEEKKSNSNMATPSPVCTPSIFNEFCAFSWRNVADTVRFSIDS